MNKTKSLLSIILFAILGTLVVSCGEDDPTPTGVTLSGSWMSVYQKALPTNYFEYTDANGVNKKGQVMADKRCLRFIPVNKFATSGTGTYLVEYPYGPLARVYRQFHWSLDKSNPNNTITNVTFDDNNEKLTLYRTCISSSQFSYSLNEDLTDPIGYNPCTSVDWSKFTTSAKDTREDWIEAYENWMRVQIDTEKQENTDAK